MEAFLEEFLSYCERFEPEWGGPSAPADYFLPPSESIDLRPFVDRFGKAALASAGLLRADEGSDPALPTDEPFTPLRDANGQVYDLLHDNGCLSRKPALLQIRQDRRFRDVADGQGLVCLVDNVEAMAKLELAGIPSCPGNDLVSATTPHLSAIGGFYSIGPPQEAEAKPKTRIVVANWSVTFAHYEDDEAANLRIAGLRRLCEATGESLDEIQLWRPSPSRIDVIQNSFADLDTLRDTLHQSLARDLRGFDELLRPPNGWASSIPAVLIRMYQLGQQKKTGDQRAWQEMCSAYRRAVSANFMARDVVPFMGADSPEAMRAFASALARQRVKIRIPALIEELAQLSSNDQAQVDAALSTDTLQVIQSMIRQEIDEPGRTAAKSKPKAARKASAGLF